MTFPQDLKYTKDHEWIKIDGDTGIVGITDFAQNELGDIIYVDLKAVGSSFKQNEIFGTVEAVKTVSDLFLPVSGTILEINENLAADASVVNNDPYGKGWMVKVKLSNPAQIEELLSAEGYKVLVG
ncbi:MAG: glycine cleavage system protein GcvH [Bacteroidetes bacterium]|nr:glycine cleavage system protein GcvH [Bacteroidota bacterium]